jgi:hypothetical protein
VSDGLSLSQLVFIGFAFAPSEHFYRLNRQRHDQCSQQERGDYESEENLHQRPHVNLLRGVRILPVCVERSIAHLQEKPLTCLILDKHATRGRCAEQFAFR